MEASLHPVQDIIVFTMKRTTPSVRVQSVGWGFQSPTNQVKVFVIQQEEEEVRWGGKGP